MKRPELIKSFTAIMIAYAVFLTPIAVMAQTRISMPSNRYKVSDDVELGRKASAEIEQQFPVLNDRDASAYVERVGQRLVAAIPQQFNQPAFNYRFQIVNASDLNAFALPGGPMYVNRGMIQQARNEGEMAGVMAHEISHVALRHATAQATKQGSARNTLGMLGMILGGAILGGQTGAQLGMLGATAWMTRYSREYETQSDMLGAQIMANAGYDPRDLANVFRTIAGEGSGRAPEWLSSHPDPGNRFERINREATLLRVSPNPIRMTADFERVQARLRSMPPAKTMAQLEREYKGGQGSNTAAAGGRYMPNVQMPSGQRRAYQSGNWLRVNVPANWRELAGSNDVMFAPEGAYGDQGITHGVMLGVARSSSNDLRTSSIEFVNGLLQANNYLQRRSDLMRSSLSGRTAFAVSMAGRSPITGRTELVNVYTTSLRNGSMFYYITVVPENESYSYTNTFRAMMQSLRLND
jgi:beta-barrel assembly-enhancing protease